MRSLNESKYVLNVISENITTAVENKQVELKYEKCLKERKKKEIINMKLKQVSFIIILSSDKIKLPWL